MNYSIDITVATKRDLADAFDYIDGMLMNPSAADRLIDNAWKQFRSLDIFPQRFPSACRPTRSNRRSPQSHVHSNKRNRCCA